MAANPAPLYLEEPLSIDEARAASKALARQRREVERLLEDQVTLAADAELAYRQKLSQEIIKAEGTAAAREAEARANSAPEARTRDIAAGMLKVLQERLRGLEGERSQLRALMDMSARQFNQ